MFKKLLILSIALASVEAFATSSSAQRYFFVQYHFNTGDYAGKKVTAVMAHTGVVEHNRCDGTYYWADVKDAMMTLSGDHFNARARLIGHRDSGCTDIVGPAVSYQVFHDDGTSDWTGAFSIPNGDHVETEIFSRPSASQELLDSYLKFHQNVLDTEPDAKNTHSNAVLEIGQVS